MKDGENKMPLHTAVQSGDVHVSTELCQLWAMVNRRRSSYLVCPDIVDAEFGCKVSIFFAQLLWQHNIFVDVRELSLSEQFYYLNLNLHVSLCNIFQMVDVLVRAGAAIDTPDVSTFFIGSDTQKKISIVLIFFSL